MKVNILLLIIIPLFSFSQIEDNFSDGSFMEDPAWSGDISQFKISTSSAVPASMRPALQLDAYAADSSYLSLQVPWSDLAEWRFWIKQSFNSSSNNHSKIFLVSDNPNLESPLNGYFIQFGGKEDSVLFCRQNGTTVTRLLTGAITYTGNSTNVCRIKMTRDENGTWKLFADPEGGTDYSLDGSCTDLEITKGNYFGLLCKYSSSNTSNIYFDDFYMGGLQQDTIPPEITHLGVDNDSVIDLFFSERITMNTLSDIKNYFLIENSEYPTDCLIDEEDRDHVSLPFKVKFIQNASYHIIIQNLEDDEGNRMNIDTVSFTFFIAQPYDIVINEIFADPNPGISLPEFEFLELYNTTDQEVSLEGWKLRTGSSWKTFEATSIAPGSFLIITDEEALSFYSSYGKTVSVPSFSVSNSGQEIELVNRNGRTMSFISFDLSWYKDNIKSEGGWSIEQKDPLSPCTGKSNWSASNDPDGGTPGRINSIDGLDDDRPRPMNVCLLGSSLIELTFSQAMDSASLSSLSCFSVNHNIDQPVTAQPIKPDYRSVSLGFTDVFTKNTIYTLSITDQVKNCRGVMPEGVTVIDFGVPEKADSNDVVINEVLFNPLGDGSDYVEIYNRSAKPIDISSLYLGAVSHTPPNPPDTTLERLTSDCALLLPGKYLLLTKDPENIKKQYFVPDRDAFQELASFPYYNNDEGVVILTDIRSQIIDEFHYDEDMHSPLLVYTDGVSLERIHFDRPSGERINWHSAAESAGFGTPGYKNSQFVEFQQTTIPFTLGSRVFSPDGDGKSDFLEISYHFPEPGMMGSLYIFDSEGRLVRNLVRNDLLGTAGFFTWDGTNNNRQMAFSGLYIVLFEVFSTNGKTGSYRQACALVR